MGVSCCNAIVQVVSKNLVHWQMIALSKKPLWLESLCGLGFYIFFLSHLPLKSDCKLKNRLEGYLAPDRISTPESPLKIYSSCDLHTWYTIAIHVRDTMNDFNFRSTCERCVMGSENTKIHRGGGKTESELTCHLPTSAHN